MARSELLRQIHKLPSWNTVPAKNGSVGQSGRDRLQQSGGGVRPRQRGKHRFRRDEFPGIIQKFRRQRARPVVTFVIGENPRRPGGSQIFGVVPLMIIPR